MDCSAAVNRINIYREYVQARKTDRRSLLGKFSAMLNHSTSSNVKTTAEDPPRLPVDTFPRIDEIEQLQAVKRT